jgi:hypothetical protein
MQQEPDDILGALLVLIHCDLPAREDNGIWTALYEGHGCNLQPGVK